MAILQKESRRYEGYLYWWDITPKRAESIDKYEIIEFVKKDTNESCKVQVSTLRKYLTKQRQTTRGEGNWGIRVIVDHPDELAFEPGAKGGDWLFMPVVWRNSLR